MRIRLILTNTSLVALGLLAAQLPGLSQGQKPAAPKTTTESGWYKYGQPIPDLKDRRRSWRMASQAWRDSGRRRAART